MNHYETVFIATPVLSDDQVKETVKKFRDLLIDKKAEIVYENNWGLKKLAYPIQKKSTGFYYLIEFLAEPTVVAELELAFKRDERILRYLTVSVDKHAIAFSIKKRNEKAKKLAAEA